MNLIKTNTELNNAKRDLTNKLEGILDYIRIGKLLKL